MKMKSSSDLSSEPLVSVILPAYNCAPYLRQALDSVTNQTYKNLEIIVVDDGSTDTTWDLLNEIATADTRIKPFRNEVNLRIVGSLNRAIRESHGKYLARMDGDDVRLPGSIAAQVSFLESHEDVVIVGGVAEVCDQEMKVLNRRAYPLDDAAVRQKIFRYSPHAHGCVVIRADALEADPYRYNWAEDYDLYFRLGQKGKFANLPDVLYQIRTHPHSVSRTKARYQEKLTLYIRLKAVMEYGYTMTLGDKAYFVAQLLTMYIMPPGFRFWLFNKIRAVRS